MGETDRKAVLASFRAGPERLRKAVKGLPPALIDFRPFADAWTIRENVAHLCDAEAYAYARHRKALAEPGARVDMWDEIKFHERLRYGSRDMAAALALYAALRLATADLLDLFAAEDWSGYTVEHAKRGTMTLEGLPEFFADHDTFHLDLIERNKKLWKEKKGAG